jgi:hypothetical protein
MARESAGATLVVMTDEYDHGHRATSRLYRGRVYAIPISMPQTCRSKLARQTAAVRVDLVPATFGRSSVKKIVLATAG